MFLNMSANKIFLLYENPTNDKASPINTWLNKGSCNWPLQSYSTLGLSQGQIMNMQLQTPAPFSSPWLHWNPRKQRF